MRSLTGIALLALFLASLAGCGGGGGTDAGWIEEADAICRANESATAIMQRGLPHLGGEIAALRRLRPPTGNDLSLFPLVNLLIQKHAVGESVST